MEWKWRRMNGRGGSFYRKRNVSWLRFGWKEMEMVLVMVEGEEALQRKEVRRRWYGGKDGFSAEDLWN